MYHDLCRITSPGSNIHQERNSHMSLWLKKGTKNASGRFIYPEPTQTGTGNCAAYAGAACLYAFGLDRQPGLIPSVSGPPDMTDREKFNEQIRRMIERLTDLIYGAGGTGSHPSGMADGFRKFIANPNNQDPPQGYSDEFEVTVISGGTYKLPDGHERANWDFILDELRRCQDIIPRLEWSNGCCKGSSGHAVTLVGVDEATGEAVVANPWGTPTDTIPVPPDEAGSNTEAGKTERAHTKYKYTKGADGEISVEFEGRKAKITHFIKICPVERVAARVEHRVGLSGSESSEFAFRRYEYALANTSIPSLNGFAIELPGVRPQDLGKIGSPQGWAASLWFREREPGFDPLPPEALSVSSGAGTFAGIVWRAVDANVLPLEQTLPGFFLEVVSPNVGLDAALLNVLDRNEVVQKIPSLIRKLAPALEKVDAWQDVPGRAIVLSEFPNGTHSVHLGAVVPKKLSDFPERLRKLIETL
ncbi:MAG: hypothetical protein IT581_10025 [Verrucomicrobiales bacterium]|nr:hypothetical protein [Verrucomicrobiales bacterium]